MSNTVEGYDQDDLALNISISTIAITLEFSRHSTLLGFPFPASFYSIYSTDCYLLRIIPSSWADSVIGLHSVGIKVGLYSALISCNIRKHDRI